MGPAKASLNRPARRLRAGTARGSAARAGRAAGGAEGAAVLADDGVAAALVAALVPAAVSWRPAERAARPATGPLSSTTPIGSSGVAVGVRGCRAWRSGAGCSAGDVGDGGGVAALAAARRAPSARKSAAGLGEVARSGAAWRPTQAGSMTRMSIREALAQPVEDRAGRPPRATPSRAGGCRPGRTSSFSAEDEVVAHGGVQHVDRPRQRAVGPGLRAPWGSSGRRAPGSGPGCANAPSSSAAVVARVARSRRPGEGTRSGLPVRRHRQVEGVVAGGAHQAVELASTASRGRPSACPSTGSWRARRGRAAARRR